MGDDKQQLNQYINVDWLLSVYIEVCNLGMIPPCLLVLALEMKPETPCNNDNPKRERNTRNPGHGIARFMR